MKGNNAEETAKEQRRKKENGGTSWKSNGLIVTSRSVIPIGSMKKNDQSVGEKRAGAHECPLKIKGKGEGGWMGGHAAKQ